MERVTRFWRGRGVILRKLHLKLGSLSGIYDNSSIEDIELRTSLAPQGIPIRLLSQIQMERLKQWTVGSRLSMDPSPRANPRDRLMRASTQSSTQLNVPRERRIASPAAMTFVTSISLAVGDPLVVVLAVLSFGVFLVRNLGFIALIRRKRGFTASLLVVPLCVVHSLASVLLVAAPFLYAPFRLPPTPSLEPLLQP